MNFWHANGPNSGEVRVLYRPAAPDDLDQIHDATREMWGLAQASTTCRNCALPSNAWFSIRAAAECMMSSPPSTAPYAADAT